LAAKGKDKESRKQLKQGFKKIFLSSAFVNLPANMGSKNEFFCNIYVRSNSSQAITSIKLKSHLLKDKFYTRLVKAIFINNEKFITLFWKGNTRKRKGTPVFLFNHISSQR
jgi:hypothetical protein